MERVLYVFGGLVWIIRSLVGGLVILFIPIYMERKEEEKEGGERERKEEVRICVVCLKPNRMFVYVYRQMLALSEVRIVCSCRSLCCRWF